MKPRRQLWQRFGRDNQRALQSRGDPLIRAMAILQSRRIRHARMGDWFKNRCLTRAHRQHTACEGWRTLLRPCWTTSPWSFSDGQNWPS